jgi:hypothetical protein
MAQILLEGFLSHALFKLQSLHLFQMPPRPVPVAFVPVSMPQQKLLKPLFRPPQVIHQVPPATDIIPDRFFLPARNMYPRGNFVADASPFPDTAVSLLPAGVNWRYFPCPHHIAVRLAGGPYVRSSRTAITTESLWTSRPI